MCSSQKARWKRSPGVSLMRIASRTFRAASDQRSSFSRASASWNKRRAKASSVGEGSSADARPGNASETLKTVKHQANFRIQSEKRELKFMSDSADDSVGRNARPDACFRWERRQEPLGPPGASPP